METTAETLVNGTTAADVSWQGLADKALRGERLTMAEGLAVLEADDSELLSILDAAYRVRKHYYGNKVKLNLLINAKSGLCPEDCGYCSQSIVSKAPVDKYPMIGKATILEGARRALEMKVGTYCIVASGRGPKEQELETVISAVKEIKETMPLKICVCMGILSDEQAQRLKDAGVDRYNHNLNTHQEHFDKITTTHTYSDRVSTVEKIKNVGISACSGCIIGMGETNRQIVELAYSLRELDADSIPVNFLNSIPGTPMENMNELNPRKCLKVLSLFRLINPAKEIRIAGGREVHLKSLQPLGLYAANSIFLGDYLTTEGQEANEDHRILEDLGFEIEISAL